MLTVSRKKVSSTILDVNDGRREDVDLQTLRVVALLGLDERGVEMRIGLEEIDIYAAWVRDRATASSTDEPNVRYR